MMNCILLLIFFTFHCVYGGENYYTLLGVPTDASKSQIRKAFKKLALEKHPDKNKGKNAHDIFLEINKAYEVLKDEELRKKYDRYGEAGLKDDHFSNNYQSWTYYNEQFGIYDDDQDIVTLSRTDFEQSVSASEDVWFINFYSPHCTHCHTLAPEWRKLSEDLSGVIRIGAVNCHDDWSLCNMEGISGYPTLRIYPSAEDYYGPHSAESMVSHVFSRVNIDVTYVNQENENTIYDSDMSWLLAFCTDDSDCVDNKAILKISAMLEDLVSVGLVNCNAQQTICEKLQHTEGVYFYSTPADVKTNKAVLIDSLDCKEIVHKVLDQLPHQPIVNDELFQQIRRNISENRSNAWVFIFVNEENEYDQELRKLPALVDSINIGRVICSDAKNFCKRFLVTKYPTVIVYKKIGYEIHHGRMFSHDIANFAKESLSSNVRVMGPEDFIKIKQTDESYFIDFFAPWCPPCMKLLPEWRKAGSVIGEKLAKFGTVDCTVHPDLCSQMSIHSYPTAIFYNMSKTHIFSGYHTKDQIIEFAEDIKQPPVISVTPDYFAQHINKKVVGVTWILKFFAPWCQPCVQMAPAYSKLAKQLKEQDVLVGEINCQEYRVLCKTLGVQQYPAIRLLPADSEGLYRFVQHYGHRDFTSLFVWATEHLPSSVQYITEPEMYQILDSHTPWLLDFYTPWCGHCTRFAPFYAQLAKKFEKVGVRAGKVNCQENYALCRNVGIRSYPSLRYYYGVKDTSMSQPISGTVMDSQDIDYLYNAIVQMDQQYKQQGNIEQEGFTSRQHDEF